MTANVAVRRAWRSNILRSSEQALPGQPLATQHLVSASSDVLTDLGLWSLASAGGNVIDLTDDDDVPMVDTAPRLLNVHTEHLRHDTGRSIQAKSNRSPSWSLKASRVKFAGGPSAVPIGPPQPSPSPPPRELLLATTVSRSALHDRASTVACPLRTKRRVLDFPPGQIHAHVRTGLLDALMQRIRFRGTVARLGKTRGGRKVWQKPTVLLTEVQACEGKKINGKKPHHTDHVWLKVGKQLSVLGLRPGSVVEFDARVRWYRKAGGWDLQLSHHTKIALARRTLHPGTGAPAPNPLSVPAF